MNRRGFLARALSTLLVPLLPRKAVARPRVPDWSTWKPRPPKVVILPDGQWNGTYSVCITEIRRSAGLETIRSEQSEVFTVKNQRVSLKFENLHPRTSEILIYLTAPGFAVTGPWMPAISVSAFVARIDLPVLVAYPRNWGLCLTDHPEYLRRTDPRAAAASERWLQAGDPAEGLDSAFYQLP